MRMITIFFYVFISFLLVFSYGFVDANFPHFSSLPLTSLIRTHRGSATLLYIVCMVGLMSTYLWLLYHALKHTVSAQAVQKLLLGMCFLLLLSYPAFSYDVFNYIATAKVTFTYQENPYIVMPIDIKNEPMLAYMHAANKTALYGPVWIAITALPLALGMGDILLTLFTFKLLAVFFYLGLVYLIWRLSEKNIFSVLLFACNPLVITETLVSGHNDVVMMFFALLSFLLLQKKRLFFAGVALILSIGIKFATVVLVPVFCYVVFQTLTKKKIQWQRVWLICAIAMYGVFLISPIREELYPWYFIWPLTFVSLTGIAQLIVSSVVFSFGLLFRFAPFVYTGEWGGSTPMIKFFVSYLPPVVASVYMLLFRKK